MDRPTIKVTPEWPHTVWQHANKYSGPKDEFTITKPALVQYQLEKKVITIESTVPLTGVVSYNPKGKNRLVLMAEDSEALTISFTGSIEKLKHFYKPKEEKKEEKELFSYAEFTHHPAFQYPTPKDIWYDEWFYHLVAMWKMRPRGLYVSFDDFTDWAWYNTTKRADPKKGVRNYAKSPPGHFQPRSTSTSIKGKSGKITDQTAIGIPGWYDKLVRHINGHNLEIMQMASSSNLFDFCLMIHEHNSKREELAQIPEPQPEEPEPYEAYDE